MEKIKVGEIQMTYTFEVDVWKVISASFKVKGHHKVEVINTNFELAEEDAKQYVINKADPDGVYQSIEIAKIELMSVR